MDCPLYHSPDILNKFNPLDSKGNYSATSNKCIGDDTKTAARQSLNCIKNKKK